MSTFYLLPPRACLEQAVSELFGKLLPGLPLPVDMWETLTRELASTACWPAEVYFVPRDELPDGEVGGALVEGYGAEEGDRVVEVSLARPARTWVVSADVSSIASAR